jgi:hypothetical protein
MTLIIWDGKTLSTDSLFLDDVEDTVVHRGSKLFVVNRQAVATCGSELDGTAFIQWVQDGRKESEYPKMGDDFSGVLLTDTEISAYMPSSPKAIPQCVRFGLGHGAAVHYANALMDRYIPAPEALRLTCNYSLLISEPIYSLTRAQLKQFPKDYVGLYAGTIPGQEPKKAVKKR